MTKKTPKSDKIAAAYMRTSSATNVGEDKDSHKRQKAAIRAYARANGIKVVEWFNDAAVSGADALEDRPGFSSLLDYMLGNGAKIILCESASRFARDTVVQELGYKMLRERGLELIPVDSPEHFQDDSDNPSRELVRVMLGAVSTFEKKGLVLKLKKARDRKRAETGKCEGRKPYSELVPDTVALAKKLRRKNPHTHKRRSYRTVAAMLAEAGYMNGKGRMYDPRAIQAMTGSAI